MNKLIIVLVICFVLISLLVCCGAYKNLTYNKIDYVVHQGDTLWALHGKYGQAIKYHTWIDKMYEVNQRDTGELMTGERIILLEVAE